MRDSQPGVTGVRFRNAGKIFYFDAAGMRLEPGEYVIVETSRGPEVGRVVIAPGQVVVNELGREELKPILRLATDDDIVRADALKQRAEELLPEARRLGEELQFPARIDTAEFTLDGRRLTFIASSDDRLDHRDFVRRAADQFKVRVDVRQVGARDRAKLAGGYGICGRELCCASWLATFPSISIRMAKEQELPLNPQKISGLCGRLLCCLSYEEEGYKEMRKTLPKIGQRCSTPTGEGKVIGVNILRRQVTLIVDGQRVEVGDRDLGTVVRWDTASKSGEPPPSISRADAIAQGLIEATEEDLRPPQEPVDDWLNDAAREPGAGRGRLPRSAGPRRESRPAASQSAAPPRRPEREPRPERGEPRSQPQQPAPRERDNRRTPRPADASGTEQQQPRQQPRRPQRGPQPPPVNLPEGRRFQRATPPPSPANPAPASPEPEGASSNASARRRGRRGRGRREGGEGPAQAE